MCGIFGLIKLKGYNSDNDVEVHKALEQIASRSEARGADAGGFACIPRTDSKLRVFKRDMRITDLMRTKGYRKYYRYFSDSPIIIGHTRAQTRGNAINNDNNHPVWNHDKTAVVTHNGSIWNYDELVKNEELTVRGEVDTEAIISLWDKFDGNYKEFLPKLGGTFAFAILNEKEPNMLRLFKHSNPLYFALCSEWNVIFYASDDVYIRKSLKEEKCVLFEEEKTKSTIKCGEHDMLYQFNTENPYALDIMEKVTIPYRCQTFRNKGHGAKGLPSPRSHNAYNNSDYSDDTDAINAMFNKREQRFKADKKKEKNKNGALAIVDEMTASQGVITIENASPFFGEYLTRKFREWKPLIENYEEEYDSDTAYRDIQLYPNPKAAKGHAQKRLSKLLIKLECDLLKTNNIEQAMEDARVRELERLDKGAEDQIDNSQNGQSVFISPLLDESDIEHFIELRDDKQLKAAREQIIALINTNINQGVINLEGLDDNSEEE